jgi:uncharacterized membrane protein YbhN (UPF0104 family)
MNKRLQLIAGVLITVVTIGLFGFYLAAHGSVVHQLTTTSPRTIILLLILFAFWFGSMVLILQATLRICNLDIPSGENLMLNAYSTFLNYFVPGQSGPILRGLYLKGRYELPFRRYLFSTLMYYVVYAGVSMLLLIGGVKAWWQTLIGVLLVSLAAYIGARFYARNHNLSRRGLDFGFANLAFLIFATCAQAICQVAIYGVELNSVDPGLRIGQVMSYTGAANFALFVSITPGAVGIRETFLIFSEKLHRVSNAAIVGANVLDRSTYIVFLAVVFIVLLVTRGKSIFKLKNSKGEIYIPAASQKHGGAAKAPYIKTY